MSLKREIALLASEKGLEDLYHMTDVCLVSIHGLKGSSEGAQQLNRCERLGNALFNVVKHPSDNDRV